MRIYFFFKILSVAIRSGLYSIIRASFILLFVIGFLYSLHVGPHINYYYFVEPYEKSKFTYFYDVVVDPSILRDPEKSTVVTDNILACFDNIDYLAESGYEFYIDGLDNLPIVQQDGIRKNRLTLIVASSISSLSLVFPGIDIETIRKLYPSIDGILVDAPDVVGYRLPQNMANKVIDVELIHCCKDLKIRTKLLVVRSNYPFAKGLVAALVGSNYTEIIYYIMSARFIIGLENTSRLDSCLDKVITDIRRKYTTTWPPIYAEVRVKSRGQAYEESLNAVYSSHAMRIFMLFSTLALIVAFIVSLREGIAYAESSSDLIGLLRILGAPRVLIFLVGFIVGSIVSSATTIGIIVMPYLYFEKLIGISLPPISFLFSKTVTFIALILITCPLAFGLGNLWHTSRRSLESYVSTSRG